MKYTKDISLKMKLLTLFFLFLSTPAKITHHLHAHEIGNLEQSSLAELVDSTSPYALTGCVMATNKAAIAEAAAALTHSAGNFYINDKPTGAVVGQQPFGGSRASGTNDKAGSMFNLARWVSQRTVKENFDPPKDYRYPFLADD